MQEFETTYYLVDYLYHKVAWQQVEVIEEELAQIIVEVLHYYIDSCVTIYLAIVFAYYKVKYLWNV